MIDALITGKNTTLFLNCEEFCLNVIGLIVNYFSIASKGVFAISSFFKLPCFL